jgi:hypothetical protein
MLTGRRAFEGEDVSLTLSQILQREPALDALPGDVPARVRQTVHLCLRKPLKERLPDIGAARLMLEGAFETRSDNTTPGVATPQRTWRRAAPLLLTGIAGAILGTIGVWPLMRGRDSGPPQRGALCSAVVRQYRATGYGGRPTRSCDVSPRYAFRVMG